MYVEMPKSRLYNAAAQIKTMWHHSGAENAAAEVQAFIFDNRRRWQIAFENLANRRISDERKLNAETDNNPKDKDHDEAFERSEAAHGTIWAIEDENDEDID